MYCLLNDRLLQEKKAGISINNRTFRYGYGFFETMLCHQYKIRLEHLHAARISRSMTKLSMEVPVSLQRRDFPAMVYELLRKNGLEAMARVRICFYSGDGGLFDKEQPTNILIQCWPLEEARTKLNDNGFVVGNYDYGFKAADELANIKSNNYLLYAMAAGFSRSHHWNDAVVLNHSGRVADTCIANIWCIKNNVLYTPSLSEGPVAGVMRQHLLAQASTAGIKVVEQALTVQDLLEAEGIFLSNCIMGVKWIGQYLDKHYEPHPLMRQLAGLCSAMAD